jgi:hypothetical protein
MVLTWLHLTAVMLYLLVLMKRMLLAFRRGDRVRLRLVHTLDDGAIELTQDTDSGVNNEPPRTGIVVDVVEEC